MIADKMSNLGNYNSVIPFFEKISSFLAENDLHSLAAGKYEINGSDAFIIISEYETQNEPEKKWESHKNYLDVQIVVEGIESIGYTFIKNLTVSEPYNAEKDLIFYQNTQAPTSSIIMNADEFAVFYPDDGHKPGCVINQPVTVKKAVIKVRVN